MTLEKNQNNIKTKRMILSALFIAIGIVLPFFTGQIPQVGKMLLPMHIPVLLCGLICGWKYGAITGFFLPIIRSILFGMPMFYPNAIAMAFELATYGFVVGVLYHKMKKQSIGSIYGSMLSAMICGRIVLGIAELLLLGLKGDIYTWEIFITGAVFTAVPGICIQLILIPAIMVHLNRTGFVIFQEEIEGKS